MEGPGRSVSINGLARPFSSPLDRSLLELLRYELDLTGTKYGCGEGECGACTVLLDGQPVRSCQVRLSEVLGRSVVTVEGLSEPGRLGPVAAAFAELHAYQCGFCTPGMIVGATALIARRPDPTDSEIRQALEGHLCRCCGYARIVRAVARAAELARRASAGAP